MTAPADPPGKRRPLGARSRWRPDAPLPPRVPRLLAITDLSGRDATGLDDWLAGLAAAGIDAVQVREKGLADRDLLALVRRVRAALPPPVAVLVNGRGDVALAGGADGVHLPAAGLPGTAIRRLAGAAGRPLLIGRSTHTPEEVRTAAAEGADGVDYVTFGPVYATPSKERYGTPPGLPGLREAARAGVPILALGGVAPGCLAELAAAGAAGAAGIRVFGDLSLAGALAAEAREVWGPRGPTTDRGW